MGSPDITAEGLVQKAIARDRQAVKKPEQHATWDPDWTPLKEAGQAVEAARECDIVGVLQHYASVAASLVFMSYSQARKANDILSLAECEIERALKENCGCQLVEKACPTCLPKTKR